MVKNMLRYSGFAALAAVTMTQSALADDAPAAAPAAPADWWDSFSLGVEAEVGITGNPNNKMSAGDYGHLFTDKENQLLVNQLSITAARPFDPKATDFDWGFKFEGMYGTDSRYTHFLGELTHVTSDRTQLDIVEASLSAHLPILTDGGVDVKLGQYPTPVGYEVIEPSGNPFYSHSYIFNFGIPLKHTGGYATIHVNDTLDLWAGIDSGVNTSLGSGDNNDEPGYILGFGLNNLLDGKLTVLALSHLGPENPSALKGLVSFDPNDSFRYLNDIVITYKATDALTLVTDLNYIYDDGFKATGYGAAQYVSYAFNDNLTLNGRAELFGDDQGFFVAGFPGNLDFVNLEAYGGAPGFPATHAYGRGKELYGEVTVGATYKPDVPDMYKGLMIRPELRLDHSFKGQAYAGLPTASTGSDSYQYTAAIDVIIPLAIISPPTPPAAEPAPAPAETPPPAPPVATPEAQRSFQVFFDFDKATITDAAAQVIKAASDAVKAGSIAKINVTGHTDTVGTAAYNKKLSEKRATAVKEKLVEDGVSADEIATLGVGKEGLLVPTKDGVREPQNRRAEIVLQ